ncbi:TetR/AcrR family transcriptional regulator [Patulibacter sp.]|uniref:TetR/AcrR family transcriptional regulator n=1 Tax=Patulibacter sp. TaxID=1912859 RepID=UPI0027195939|nr:TetR/AcrR family transcriptional regulator [Patulibacter sp.]MDO9406961.1 TetR/AcrR family transcriptional regulator [Patulibacter sp.]
MARPRTFDEDLVIGRAREVFHDHGFAPTSVEDLTAATGLSRSSLYGAFGDKHRLFLRSFAQYCEEEVAVLERELTGDDEGARSRLEDHVHRKTADARQSLRGCLLAKVGAELGTDDPDVAPVATAFYATYERLLEDCVRGAQAAGDLRSDMTAGDVAAVLLATLRGIEALGRIGRPPAALRAVAAATLTALSEPRGPGST